MTIRLTSENFQQELLLICDRLRDKSAKNKMYCANPTCSHFTDLDQLLLFRGSDSCVLDCAACGVPMCIRCKSFAHAGAACGVGGM